jgi:hypothetical protein
MKLKYLFETKLDSIKTIIKQLDRWFYQYGGKHQTAEFGSIEIPSQYKRAPAIARRVRLLTEQQVRDFLNGNSSLVRNKYESWTTGEDPTGYLGFHGDKKAWYVLYFQRKPTASDVVLNIEDFGSDVEVRSILEQMEESDEVSENASHLWNYSTNEPQPEVILKSQPFKVNELAGFKSYKTHASPLAGTPLPANELTL